MEAVRSTLGTLSPFTQSLPTARGGFSRFRVWPQHIAERRFAMLRYAVIFLIIAILAGVFGFTGIAGDAAWIAKILLVVFVILFVVSLILGRRGPSSGI
jgi:uncharacterized membrane protein YtjA (UPF0391 family)